MFDDLVRRIAHVVAAIAIVHAIQSSVSAQSISTRSRPSAGASVLLDPFDSIGGWTTAPATGVSLALAQDSGLHGKAMRLDFDFHGHGGYAVVHKEFNVRLPPNYEFSFSIRGEAPPNTLEFKLIDPTWNNVWWSNQRDFVFPREWETVTRAKRDIVFAWGPAGGGEIVRVAAIEFSITAGSGGKGSVWIDDLKFVPLPDRLNDSVSIFPTYPGAHAVARTKSIEWNWVFAELIVLLVMVWFWKILSRDETERLQGIVAAVAAYGALLLVMAHVLGVIWQPLVTISFALAGAALLLASRQSEKRGLLLKLAGLTMVVVVGRLLIVDLSSVETIWRVLLFLICGSMFVYTSYRLQLGKGVKKAT
jgi:hypothetical protein